MDGTGHPPHLERRRWPRVATMGSLTAQDQATREDLDVLDLGMGGCALRYRDAVAIGTFRTVEIVVKATLKSTVRVQAASCRPSGDTGFVVGCRFIGSNLPRVQQQAATLLDLTGPGGASSS